ncbi:ABC transporter permease subunit [Mesorhizobium sp. STM 4661]|uniref:ABC transporter permease subunit n=1 Tax=Mesorhizobium sp. STM 4661 TaxID=1297570 RepID=UPI0002BE4DB4|nr:ABC transporter permease subunit [Mesorhizobium sp. STM 4661]CCV12757.1 ABC transporter, permease [Mesorhizobium sp. STM 4661]
MKAVQKRDLVPAGLVAPALAVLLIVFGIPMVQLFLTSVSAPTFSLGNYRAFFGQPANIRVLLQTIQISAVTTVICVIIGYPIAYLIVGRPKRLRRVLTVLVFVPYLTSVLARTYAWVAILGDRGLINNLLLDMGLISNPLPLIYNRTAVYVGMVHIMLPIMILPLVSVMLGIDKSLMVAARSMGARPFGACWRVFLPLSLPGLRAGSLLVFISCLGFYITPAALGGLRDTMLSTFIASAVSSSFDLARIATSAFVLLAVVAAILFMFGVDLSDNRGFATRSFQKPGQSRPSLVAAVGRSLSEIAAPYRARRWALQLYRAGEGGPLWATAGTVSVGLVLLYLLFPSIVVIIMSFSPGTHLQFPPSGLSLQWYHSFFGNPSWTGAAWTSIQIGVAVAILSTAVGTLAAFGLSRTSSRVRSILTLGILMPIILPIVVVGIAAYLGLLNLGLVGTKIGIVLAHSIGAVGMVVVIVSASLGNFDRRLEQAAMSMSAGPFRTFTKVTLPLIRPGMIGGSVFAFLFSFDEVIITSLVSGFSIRTLPLKMWENMRNEIDPTIAAVASLLTLLPVLWLAVLGASWWRANKLARRTSPDPAA